MEIKIVNKSGNPLPAYQSGGSAGMDLYASLAEDIVLNPMQRELIPTGIFIELPDGFEAQVRPRSGLAARNGVTVLNSPGTIDPDYRGEIRVILINFSDKEFTIKNGDRIAQLVISKFESIQWEQVNMVNKTDRNSGGFGSTGR